MYRSFPLCMLQFPVDFYWVLWFKFTALATAQGGIEMWEGDRGGAVH